MADPKDTQELARSEATTETAETRQLYLRDGRTLSVSGAGTEELVEIHGSSGMLELRIKLTEAGPVLQMESVRLQLKATESIDIERATEAAAAARAALASTPDDAEAVAALRRAELRLEVAGVVPT